ncbi:hypothetical protein D9619_007630 [Psilocybe cf. subviscida]|uniref:Uncharacterized protein n=1 Tax=Psilocybe cf. subviscida TaxID=2480587 RepID=A0A8H5AU85_9AGAR|nr:hypothetical protein D9619_007630 [Psilocybe cf. subviscida]
MTTKRKPTRASSPESDFVDRMSSSPEPPEDPLAGVLIGSQSRAAKRGEYVPVPTRSYLASQSSLKTRASNAMPAPAACLVSRPKPASKLQPTAKPPSRIQSRPPVSKGKGKAKDVVQVIEIIDSEDDAPRPSLPTVPLNPSRRENVAPPRSASTSTTLPVKVRTTTTSRKKRSSACPIEQRSSAIHDRADSSADESEGIALVTAEEGTSVGSSSQALGSTAKRRRVEEPVGRELGKADVEADAGAPMDVVVDADLGVHLNVDMDVDAGYQSDATLSYVSDEHETAPEAEQTSDRRRHTPDEAPEVEEKPFPDFESLRGSKSGVICASAPLSSKAPSSLSAGASGSCCERENAVAGPSNSNIASANSTSTSNAGSSKPNSNSNVATGLKLNPHSGLFDDSGLSPEDAAAVYAAMFDDDDVPVLPPVPASMSVPSVTAASPAPVVPDTDQRLDEEPRDNGKGKARAEPDPVVDPAAEQAAKPVPVQKWGEWDPLRAICADPTANGSEKQTEDYLDRGKGSKLPTMEEHFLRALRAATAVNRDEDVKGKGKAVEEDNIPPYVAYMRRAARAFEQAWDGGGALGDASMHEGNTGKEKEGVLARFLSFHDLFLLFWVASYLVPGVCTPPTV